MISYDEMINRYGVGINIKNLYYNSDRADFRGIRDKEGQYVVCKLDIVINKFNQTKIEDVVVPLTMLHSLMDIDLINKTIFKDMANNSQLKDSEITELQSYYNKYNKIIDSVFSNNNMYGVSYGDFNKLIDGVKIDSQIEDVNKVSLLFNVASENTVTENMFKKALTSYYLQIHRYFNNPTTRKIDINSSNEVYYTQATKLINQLNRGSNVDIKLFVELKDLIKSNHVNVDLDIGGYKLIDSVKNINIRKQLLEIGNDRNILAV